MKVSQFLVSTAAAATVVGAIGFAYAQSGDNVKDSKPTMQNEATPNSSMQNPTQRSSTGADGAATNNNASGMTNERMARADRN